MLIDFYSPVAFHFGCLLLGYCLVLGRLIWRKEKKRKEWRKIEFKQKRCHFSFEIILFECFYSFLFCFTQKISFSYLSYYLIFLETHLYLQFTFFPPNSSAFSHYIMIDLQLTFFFFHIVLACSLSQLMIVDLIS